MSESFSAHTPSPQRRIVATVIAIGVVVIMAIAFFSGGSAETEPVKEDNLADTPIHVDDEFGTHNPDEAINPDDWINVATGNLAQTPSSSENSTGPAVSQSTVVVGDKLPAAAGSPTPTPTIAATTPQSVVTAPQSAATAPQSVAKTPKSESSASRPASSPAEQATKPEVSAQTSASSGEPVFVKPSVQRTGLIAQSKGLITEPQIRRNQTNKPATESSSPQATASKSPSRPALAKVRHQEAREFAQQTTDNLRQQGLLKPQQKVRLPKIAESNNPRVWKEDEPPTSADERRPFGLIVVDENPATTPEGIPLRTDIPAGTSALQKTGPDKPLWKRPE